MRSFVNTGAGDQLICFGLGQGSTEDCTNLLKWQELVSAEIGSWPSLGVHLLYQIPSLVITGDFVMIHSSWKCFFKVFNAGTGKQVLQHLLTDYRGLISMYHTKNMAHSLLFSSSSLPLHTHPGKQALVLDLLCLFSKA